MVSVASRPMFNVVETRSLLFAGLSRLSHCLRLEYSRQQFAAFMRTHTPVGLCWESISPTSFLLKALITCRCFTQGHETATSDKRLHISCEDP